MSDGNRLVRVLTALYCDAWLIEPAMHRTLCDIAQAHAFGGDREAAQHALAGSMPEKPAAKTYAVDNGVAVLPVEGVIGRKFSASLYSSGVTSIDVLGRLIAQATTDSAVSAILLAFDSPGGHVVGVPDVAQEIREARAVKPVVAYADGRMQSAAYWLAAQASAIYGLASADVGSIGAYSVIVDRTRQAEAEGVRVEVFKSGKHKAVGLPGTSLTDEQRAMMQARVDSLGEQFRAVVSEARGNRVPADAMQGQSFSGTESRGKGLIDEVSSLGQAVRDAARLGEMRAKNRGTR